jgi:hypothetical protein
MSTATPKPACTSGSAFIDTAAPRSISCGSVDVGQSQSGNTLAEGVSNMEQTETPLEPSAMSRSTAMTYAIGLPLSLLGLIFLPAGTIAWWPGWIFLVKAGNRFRLPSMRRPYDRIDAMTVSQF